MNFVAYRFVPQTLLATWGSYFGLEDILFRCSPPKLPKCCYLQCSRPCPGGVCRPQSYQSIAIYRKFPPKPRWRVSPSKLPKYRYLQRSLPKYRYLQCSRPCPGGVCRSQTYRSITIYRDLTPALVPIFMERLPLALSNYVPKHCLQYGVLTFTLKTYQLHRRPQGDRFQLTRSVAIYGNPARKLMFGVDASIICC